MYVKRHVVRRGSKTYRYLRLVEAYRDENGKVRHRVLRTLGREDELKASGQLEQLAGSFARLDPPLLGVRREVGPLLVVRHYLDRLGLAGIVERALPGRRRSLASAAEVVAVLIANRLSAPAPLYDVAGWASSAAVHELFGVPAALLNDDRLGRVLDRLAPHAESVRGAVALAAVEHLGADASRLHLDLTTLRVAGGYDGSALVAKGWSAERTVARQVRLLAAVDPAGVPLYVRPHPGNTAELACLGEALGRLRELLPTAPCVVADSAFGHLKTLAEADRAGLRFVVPLRADTGFAARFPAEVGPRRLRSLDYVSRRDRRRPPDRRPRYRGTLVDYPATDPSTGARHRWRVAYIHSSEEQASVADARERALVKAEQALARISRGLGGRYYRTAEDVTRRLGAILPPVAGLLQVTVAVPATGTPTLAWSRDQAAIDAAAATDGLYALATNLPGRLTARDVLHIYKDQALVEIAHHNGKGPLRIRPIFLHSDDRIIALLSVVGLALLVFGLIEADLRRALGPEEKLDGLLPEQRAARPTGRSILAAFQGLGLTYTRDGIRLDRLTPTQQRILELLNVPLPRPTQGQ